MIMYEQFCFFKFHFVKKKNDVKIALLIIFPIHKTEIYKMKKKKTHFIYNYIYIYICVDRLFSINLLPYVLKTRDF